MSVKPVYYALKTRINRIGQQQVRRWLSCALMTIFLAVSTGCNRSSDEMYLEDSKGETSSAAANASWALLGNGDEQRFYAEIDEINQDNVSRLGIAWFADIPARDVLSGNPLVADGVVYQSGPVGMIFAHDLNTGELRWQYNAELVFDNDNNVSTYWGVRVNRGLALWEDKVIIATGDCKLHAVNRFTGELVWKATSCNPEEFYTITAAPRVGNGLVFTGNACVDSGLNRGFVEAFDADTGEARWRFYTVPGQPPAAGYQDPVMEMAATTWGTGEWWKKSFGCGSVWEGINYDPETNLVFIGTGGPAPWNPADRGENAGDELFTNSVVALNADTGEYVWHYKVTPNDGWNLEASSQMVVDNLMIDGKERRVLMAAPKNGFFYVLDAATGEFISANNYLPVNWATGIDPASGRPIPNPEAHWWEKGDAGAEVTPSSYGARSWQPMSYNPETGLVYIPASAHSARFNSMDYGVGGVEADLYIAQRGEAKFPSYGVLIAWDPIAQKEVWRGRQSPVPANGGVISTAGGLVFQATADGYFEAYHAQTGEMLWSLYTGAAATAAPSTVILDGEQMVLLPVGNGSSGSTMMYPKLGALPATRAASRLLAFKLDGKLTLPETQRFVVNKPDLPKQPDKLAKQGSHLAEAYLCVACHGLEGEAMNGSVPDLRNSKMLSNLDALRVVVKDGALASRGMPQFPDITDEELSAIQAYIINSAWQHHE